MVLVVREERAPPWYPSKFKNSNKQLQLFGTYTREERAPPWYPFKFKNSNKQLQLFGTCTREERAPPCYPSKFKSDNLQLHFLVLVPGKGGLRPVTLLNSKTVINNYNFLVLVPVREAPPWYPYKFKSDNLQLHFLVLVPGRRGLRPGTLLNSKAIIYNCIFWYLYL